MNNYDLIYLSENEWDTADTMARIAAEWFACHPACNFVEVHEHAGWFLGYRRDLSIWSTANDGARCPGPQPDKFSGTCFRRTEQDAAASAARRRQKPEDTTMKKTLTQEQIAARDARRARFAAMVKKVAAMTPEDRAQLASQCGAVVTCEGRGLSITNTILCFLQHPGVSVVGGFRQWLRAGRCVRKGEHGLTIWIPLGVGKADADGEGAADAGDGEGGRKFGTATVFDVSQTCELPAEGSEDAGEVEQLSAEAPTEGAA